MHFEAIIPVAEGVQHCQAEQPEDIHRAQISTVFKKEPKKRIYPEMGEIKEQGCPPE